MSIRLLALFLCLSLHFFPANAANPDHLLDVVRHSGLPLESFSLLAVEDSEETPRILLSVNPHNPKTPASVTKLITAAVTLKEIPVGTRFETRLLSNAAILDGVLAGDLVLQGGGDPSFVSETLWLLVNRLTRTGIRTIQGDIVVDDSYFDDVLIDPSRDTQRSEQAYDAPVSAMSFNWNSANLMIQPGKRIGDPARVVVDPPSDYLRIDNSATTVAGSAIANLVASRREAADLQGNVISVAGSLGIHSPGFDSHRNITQPALWSGANLKLYLSYLGIQVMGEVRRAPTPQAAQLLASIEGRPVEQLVVDMNKVSSNFIAEMLTKNLAARRQQPGNMARGMDIMTAYMAQLGVAADEYLLVNPAGLTYTNRLSAHALVQLLSDMGNDFRAGPEFIASLPIAGLDGTLHNRMRDSPAQGWVRAKTGYVDGAVSLAGYAGRTDGHRVLFAFLYNGPAPAWQVRALYDELSALLVTP